MKKTILFVEDDLPTIDVYSTALEGAGFKLEIINFGEKAIERVKEIKEGKAKKPDLVLLDLILPDMNGIEVLKTMRRQRETKEVPVFVLTNYTDEQLKKKSIRFNNERYLLKTDYSPNQLVKIVKEKLK